MEKNWIKLRLSFLPDNCIQIVFVLSRIENVDNLFSQMRKAVSTKTAWRWNVPIWKSMIKLVSLFWGYFIFGISPFKKAQQNPNKLKNKKKPKFQKNSQKFQKNSKKFQKFQKFKKAMLRWGKSKMARQSSCWRPTGKVLSWQIFPANFSLASFAVFLSTWISLLH